MAFQITEAPSFGPENISSFSVISQIAERARLIDNKPPYKSSEFEYQSPLGEFWREKLVNAMLRLPHEEGRALFTQSTSLRYINDNAANHRALETLYTGPLETEGGFEKFWSRLFMENIHNAMAVRNRLREIKTEVGPQLEMSLAQNGRAQILSVAAGSSRAVLEEVAKFSSPQQEAISLKLVDINPEALSDGKDLAKSLGVKPELNTVLANCMRFNRYLNPADNYSLVEMDGIADYLPDHVLVKLMSRLAQNMEDGGLLLCSNITDNDEKEFTHRIVGWPDMIYRSQQQLAKITEEAGFKKFEITEVPLGVYYLIKAWK